jgi:hypothetical protein
MKKLISEKGLVFIQLVETTLENSLRIGGSNLGTKPECLSHCRIVGSNADQVQPAPQEQVFP